jgi:flagellar hook-length control protein FliK
VPTLSPDAIATPQRSTAKGYAVDKRGTDRPLPFASLLSGQTDNASASLHDKAPASPVRADDRSGRNTASPVASPAINRTPTGAAKSGATTAKSTAGSKMGPNQAAAGGAAAKSGSAKGTAARPTSSITSPSAADSSTESSATVSCTAGSCALDAASDQSNGSAQDAPATDTSSKDAASQLTPDPSGQIFQPPVAVSADAANPQAVAAIMIPAPAAAVAGAGSATADDGDDTVAIAGIKGGGPALPPSLALPPPVAAGAQDAAAQEAGTPRDATAIPREQARASAPGPSAGPPALAIDPTDATAKAVSGFLAPTGDGAIPDGRPRNLGAPANSAANAAANAALGVPLQAANLASPITAVRANDAAGAVPLADIAVTIAAHAQSGRSRFDIRLDPPELGRIEVQLNVDSSGNVSSRLIAERPETLDLLRRDAPQLERALQDAGLNTGDGMQFSLADQGFAGRNGLAPPDDYATRTPLGILADEPAPAAAWSGYAASSERGGGLDITV